MEVKTYVVNFGDEPVETDDAEHNADGSFSIEGKITDIRESLKGGYVEIDLLKDGKKKTMALSPAQWATLKQILESS